MYNIYFELAATGFVAIPLLYLHVEYPKASESNIRYRQRPNRHQRRPNRQELLY